MLNDNVIAGSPYDANSFSTSAVVHTSAPKPPYFFGMTSLGQSAFFVQRNELAGEQVVLVGALAVLLELGGEFAGTRDEFDAFLGGNFHDVLCSGGHVGSLLCGEYQRDVVQKGGCYDLLANPLL